MPLRLLLLRLGIHDHWQFTLPPRYRFACSCSAPSASIQLVPLPPPVPFRLRQRVLDHSVSLRCIAGAAAPAPPRRHPRPLGEFTITAVPLRLLLLRSVIDRSARYVHRWCRLAFARPVIHDHWLGSVASAGAISPAPARRHRPLGEFTCIAGAARLLRPIDPRLGGLRCIAGAASPAPAPPSASTTVASVCMPVPPAPAARRHRPLGVYVASPVPLRAPDTPRGIHDHWRVYDHHRCRCACSCPPASTTSELMLADAVACACSAPSASDRSASLRRSAGAASPLLRVGI